MERTIKRVEFRTPPKHISLTRVAAYARVSLEKDSMHHSLSAQVSYYSSMIQKHPGWVFAGIYADEAKTGTKDSRENFQRMLADCRAGKIDMVITKSISRFARNTVTLLETIRELKDLAIDVFFEEQNIHTLSSDGELMLTILASYAQEESRSASENQKWRVQKGFENGELLNWRFMLGYNIDKGKVTIDEKEAEIVREIFRRFLAGQSMNSIATYLNSAGIHGALGGNWVPQNIRRILSNEKYTGDALLWKHFRNNHIEKKKTVNRGELPRYFAEETHPAIIDKDTFSAAKARLDSIATSAASRAPYSTNAFSGIIICGRCGGKYRRIKNHQYHAWNCAAYAKNGKEGCDGLQIREDVLQQTAAEALGVKAYNEELFRNQVTSVVSGADHVLTFYFRDGSTKEVAWKTPSRAGSWTPEMKANAAERTRKQREKNHGK